MRGRRDAARHERGRKVIEFRGEKKLKNFQWIPEDKGNLYLSRARVERNKGVRASIIFDLSVVLLHDSMGKGVPLWFRLDLPPTSSDNH